MRRLAAVLAVLLGLSLPAAQPVTAGPAGPPGVWRRS